MEGQEGTTLTLTRRERLVWAALASDVRIGPKSFAVLRAAAPRLEVLWDQPGAAGQQRPCGTVVSARAARATAHQHRRAQRRQVGAGLRHRLVP